MGKEITLEQLANTTKPTQSSPNPVAATIPSSMKGARPISTSELGKKLEAANPDAKPKTVEEDSPLVANALKGMTETLAERKEFIQNHVMPVVMENAQEMAMEAEMQENNESPVETEVEENDDFFMEEDDEEEEVVTPMASYTTQKTGFESKPVEKVVHHVENEDEAADVSSDMDEMFKDLGFDDTDDDIEFEEETAEELRERFKESLNDVKIIKDPIDLNKYSIRREPVSSAAALNNINSRNALKRADWVLLHTGRPMSFVECKGPELEALRKTINTSNGINGVIESLRFIYRHVVDANKPVFEQWTKLIRTEDIESLYFGLYMACYADANYVARACIDEKNGCNKTSLIETDIKDMVKFESDKIKEEFDTIRMGDTTTHTTKIESTLMQISDDIVISYSSPTLYSTFIQYATLKPEVTQKYADYLDTMAYIDGFFTINHETKELIPLSVKEYPNNFNKTVMSKLKVFIEVMKTLSNDQFNVMQAKLSNIIETAKVSYIYPAATCPQCGTTIKEEPIESVLNLLFTRAQLVQIKSL